MDIQAEEFIKLYYQPLDDEDDEDEHEQDEAEEDSR